MVHVSINDSIKDLRFEDNSLIRVQNANIVDISDWGDEDVVKEVTTCDECEIKIDKSIAPAFKDAKIVRFIRYDYFKPAYNITGKDQAMEYLEDGSLAIKVRRN